MQVLRLCVHVCMHVFIHASVHANACMHSTMSTMVHSVQLYIGTHARYRKYKLLHSCVRVSVSILNDEPKRVSGTLAS